MLRYVVELENNHHYIIVDTITGSSYFTPAQDDARTLASILNRYENKITGQKKKMKEYKDVLISNDLIYTKKEEAVKGTCSNCANAYITFLTKEDEIYCSERDDIFKLNDSCGKYMRGE